jgi:hypothetical protein
MTEQIITKELLDELFEYKDGSLYWKIKISKKIIIGNKAGSVNGNGYWRVRLNKKLYYAHRLIFSIHHGYIPKYIDHIDGNKLNNKIENLRKVTLIQNGQNSKLGKANTSGIKNVSWSKVKDKWVVHIRINRKKKNLGYYADIELAELIAIEAREKYHGTFANHG